MRTWLEPVGLGHFDPDQFSIIKDCVYSAFWDFRYVRAYRYCARSSGQNDHLIQSVQHDWLVVRTLWGWSSRIHFESDYFRMLKFSEIFNGTGHFVQCHQNRVVTVTTWVNLCGAGQIDRHHFIVIKNRVYSAFWGFRYVRMYRFCTHVHSKRVKFSHLCDQIGHNQIKGVTNGYTLWSLLLNGSCI